MVKLRKQIIGMIFFAPFIFAFGYIYHFFFALHSVHFPGRGVGLAIMIFLPLVLFYHIIMFPFTSLLVNEEGFTFKCTSLWVDFYPWVKITHVEIKGDCILIKMVKNDHFFRGFNITKQDRDIINRLYEAHLETKKQ